MLTVGIGELLYIITESGYITLHDVITCGGWDHCEEL